MTRRVQPVGVAAVSVPKSERPIEDMFSTSAPPAEPTRWGGSRPLQWYRLIHQAEMFREWTGWGLGNVWGFITAGDYENARATLDGLLNDPWFRELEQPWNRPDRLRTRFGAARSLRGAAELGLTCDNRPHSARH